ncbi:Putative TonB-dependent receptor [Thermococcus gammatolerans EJ3]|uniref:Putative TonB-dependent receptor n=1 Tax=Thermococcus gammatolerans (strain DSM 15229 / JCM 11827 / EJ3) TaxID=593117 RepID=C5A4V4_THEGJ|nr:Putative TonB-dependent receptor [Thermococcus gammatolerans EJ3]
MGHTIYYKTSIHRWEEFLSFIGRVCQGLGYEVAPVGESVSVFPTCSLVEPLLIPRSGEGFVKTNLIEPCHSIYLLILHSVSSFGSVSVWED